MPNWQPNWNEVRWNYDASGRAAGELRRVADEIDRSCSERARAAEGATDQWRGPFRLRFDSYLQDALARGHALADEYRSAAGRIDGTANRAREEQLHRVRERERWYRERDDEDRRRREQEERNRRRRSR